MRDQQNKLNPSSKTDANGNERLERVAVSDEIAADEVRFLKSLPVIEENMDIYIQKLNLTRNYRQKMLLDKEINLKEQFPYFFTHPQMVFFRFSFDFTIFQYSILFYRF